MLLPPVGAVFTFVVIAAGAFARQVTATMWGPPQCVRMLRWEPLVKAAESRRVSQKPEMRTAAFHEQGDLHTTRIHLHATKHANTPTASLGAARLLLAFIPIVPDLWSSVFSLHFVPGRARCRRGLSRATRCTARRGSRKLQAGIYHCCELRQRAKRYTSELTYVNFLQVSSSNPHWRGTLWRREGSEL